MKQLQIKFIVIVFAGGLIFHQHTLAQQRVLNSVFGSGGAALSNGNFQMVGTLGQPLIGMVSNSTYINAVGFWYQSGGLITSVEQLSHSLPTEYRLEQNYPNPFNPQTTIQFALPKHSSVTLKIYDLLGREVATLVDEELQPGEYKVTFEASGLASGVYFYRIEAEGPSTGSGQRFVRVRKLMLLK